MFMLLFFFFFKQKTAYEMRISDWSSDVCSSDLPFGRDGGGLVALLHHHPADVVEHQLAAVLVALAVHIDDAGLFVRILLQADHPRDRVQRIAGIDRRHPAAFGIAENGHGIQPDFRHRIAENDRTEEHKSKLKTLMRIQYAVISLKNKKKTQ